MRTAPPPHALAHRVRAHPRGAPARRPSHARSITPEGAASRVESVGRADRGSVALIMVVLSVAMFAMAGLVLDGGAALAARGRAASLAQEASRAAAAALNPVSLRAATPAGLQIDPVAARAAAQRVLDAGGARGEVSIAGDTVTVTAHVTRRSLILSAFGVEDLSASAQGAASIVYGADTGRRP